MELEPASKGATHQDKTFSDLDCSKWGAWSKRLRRHSVTPPPLKTIVLLPSAYLLGGYATPSDEPYKTRGEHAEDRIDSVLSPFRPEVHLKSSFWARPTSHFVRQVTLRSDPVVWCSAQVKPLSQAEPGAICSFEETFCHGLISA